MSPAASFRSSGDLLADRRYGYAQAAFEEGDFAAAADLAGQILELVPRYAPAHALLGRSEAALGRREAAITALHHALEIEPDDALGVRLDLARLGGLAPETAITTGYVKALFDDYAPSFERHLTRSLAYRGPELVADAVRRVCAAQLRPYRFRRVLDLGCGTGLMAQALRDVADRLDGVDLSPRMVAKAAKTRLYAELHEGELVAFLRTQPEGSADLVVAADVFVYLAGLEEALSEAHRVLARDGLAAFTVQAHAGEGVILGEDARYAHGEPYLRRAADLAGFDVALLEPASTREDRGKPVPGFRVVLERQREGSIRSTA